MVFFKLFLPTTAFLLGMVSLAVFYWIVTRCREGEFIPIYYFIGLSIFSIVVLSLSRISNVLFGAHLFNYVLIEDLMIAWVSLFLFGALWQSYETSICVVPESLEE